MKKLIFYLLWLFIIGLMFTHSSCDKPEPDPYVSPFTGDTLDVNDTFQSYWNFPVGSWWVYKRTDTTADIYDTAVVITNVKEVLCRYAPDCYYDVNIHIEHSTWKMYWQEGIKNVDTTEKPRMILYTQFKDVLNFSGNLGSSMHLSWPYKFQETPYGRISDTSSWENLDASMIKSVAVVNDSYNGILRFGKNVGLVHFRFFNNTTWQLIDYKINE